MAGGVDALSVALANNGQLDVAGRLGIAAPTTVLSSKNVGGRDTDTWNEVLAGDGVIADDIPDSSVTLTVQTAGSSALRQTARCMPYVTGKPNLIELTGSFHQPTAGLRQEIGIGDGSNGILFVADGETIKLEIINDRTGSPTPFYTIAQDQWNGEQGFGTLGGLRWDFTAKQVFFIRYLWLGYGAVEWGIRIGTTYHRLHLAGFGNSVDGPYVRNPTLPLRYYISAGTTQAAPASLQETCCTGIIEGGVELISKTFTYESMDPANPTPVGSAAWVPLVTFRLANSVGGFPNRYTMQMIAVAAYATTQPAALKLAHVHDPVPVSGNWLTLNGSSHVEYSLDVVYTSTHEHALPILFVPADKNGEASGAINFEITDAHRYANQNADSTGSEYFVLYGRCISATNTSNLLYSVSWGEFS